MGKRGPKRTPTAVLERRGSWRAKARQAGWTSLPSDLECPDWMDDSAKAIWQRTVPQLAALGILVGLDVDVLARYCVLTIRWRQLMQCGEATAADKLLTPLLRLEQEFGLTPSSRASLTPSEPQTDPGKSRFFEPAVQGRPPEVATEEKAQRASKRAPRKRAPKKPPAKRKPNAKRRSGETG